MISDLCFEGAHTHTHTPYIFSTPIDGCHYGCDFMRSRFKSPAIGYRTLDLKSLLLAILLICNHFSNDSLGCVLGGTDRWPTESTVAGIAPICAPCRSARVCMHCICPGLYNVPGCTCLHMHCICPRELSHFRPLGPTHHLTGRPTGNRPGLPLCTRP